MDAQPLDNSLQAILEKAEQALEKRLASSDQDQDQGLARIEKLEAAKTSQLSTMRATVEEDRYEMSKVGAKNIGFMSRLLCQVTLPHKKMDTNEYFRQNGNIGVSVMAPSRVGLPFGTYPRLLLAHVCNEAVRTQDKTIHLGKNLNGFLGSLGLDNGGGTTRRVKAQTRSLFCSSFHWTYECDGLGVMAGAGITPVEKYQIMWDPSRPNQDTLFESTIELNEKFFKELVDRPVPICMNTLGQLSKKRSPLALDIYTWLTYRVSYLRRNTTIPWVSLQGQFGSTYKRSRDFKRAFQSRLKHVLKTADWKVHFRINEKGLVLMPPSRPHISKRAKDGEIAALKKFNGQSEVDALVMR